MIGNRKFKDLTIKNNFMFGAVMCDESNCKELLELVLQIPIKRIEVSKEKCIVYHPEYKGVRLDVYAKDEHNTHYNVEMQTIKKKALGKRARYYHSQIDMELLRSGEDYDMLPDSYVIFVCDFDPFGKKKYCYTFQQMCIEDSALTQQDGCKTIFLSTYGENDSEVSEGIVKFLQFVKADLEESKQNFEDAFVKKLQKSVVDIKESREMEERFMTIEQYIKEECEELVEEVRAIAMAEGHAQGHAEGERMGKAESVLCLLEELGVVSNEVREKIQNEMELQTLQRWLKLAAKSENMEQFLNNM